MCWNLTIIIVASSFMIIHIRQPVCANQDVESCSKIVEEECVLEWSQEFNDFRPLSTVPDAGNVKDSDIPRRRTSRPSLLHEKQTIRGSVAPKTTCLRAPSNHRIHLEVSLKPIKRDFESKCRNCESSCITFRESPPNESDMGAISSMSPHPINRTSTPTPPRPEILPTNVTNGTESNSSITSHIDRFPRHSQVIVVDIARDRKRRRCKKCRKGRRRNRQHKKKFKLFNLLLKYGRLLFEEDVRKNGRKSDLDIEPVPDPQGVPPGTWMRPTRSSALVKVLNKINRIVDKDGAMRNSKAELDAEYERNKRQARNRTRAKENESRAVSGSLNGSVTPFMLCGLESKRNQSLSISNRSKSGDDVIDVTSELASRYHTDLSTDQDDAYSWVYFSGAVNINSVDRMFYLDIKHRIGWNDALLKFMSIKITFLPDGRPKPKSAVEQVEVNDVISTHNFTPQTSESTKKTKNLTSNDVLVDLQSGPVSASPQTGHEIKIAIGAALGSLVLIFAVLFLCRRFRRRRNRMRDNSAKSHQEDVLLSGQTTPIYHLPEVTNDSDIRLKTRKQKRGRRGNTQASPSDPTQSREDEIRMLKYGRGKKKKLTHTRVERLSKEDLNSRRMHMQKNNASQKCGHLYVSMGLSQHRHCIICQIAEKPHQPIVGPQYVSEFLPPASQNPNSGSAGPNSPNSHSSFDKFNRMHNNPYRNSPNLSAGRLNLPSTISLPDGEELYRHNSGSLPNSSSRRLHPPEFMLKDRNDLYLGNQRKSNSIKSPPNRTVFDSEDLPFLTENQYRKTPRQNGYPGPPSGMCHGEQHCRTGHSKRAPQHPQTRAKQGDQLSLIHCLDRHEIEYHERTNACEDKCICKYLLKHIKEPPPHYSDVVRDDMMTSQDYDVTCIGPDETDVTTADESGVSTPFLKDSQRSDEGRDSPGPTKNRKNC